MSYEKLKPLISKVGSKLSPKEFQAVVNVVFHNYESILYDTLHADMRDSLFEQIELLVKDLEEKVVLQSQKLRLLDVGCGTGLSTQLLLKSKLGKNIDNITLLDTSKEMLKQAEKKASLWSKSYTLCEGDISKIEGEKFDVILICSVLHHIPDLSEFLDGVDALLNPNGILIHLQDPNNDFREDPIYLERLRSIQNYKGLKPYSISRFKSTTKFIKKKMKFWIGRKDYIDKVNDELLKKKVIKKRMSANEIWSVTDIHIKSDLNNESNGISFDFLSKYLKNYQLVSRRTYGFFGVLKRDLPEKFEKLEATYINKVQQNGRNLACVWLKK